MLFKDEHHFSLLPKIVFMTCISCVSLLAGYLMFADENSLLAGLKPYAINGNYVRQFILMIFCLFYILRLFFTVFVFLKRKMAWSEMLLVSGLMSVALYSFAQVGGNSFQSIGGLDYFSIILYLFGSFINTYSEYKRYVWKKNKVNKGHIYTGGLFKYSMHINYFGDVLLFFGFALITYNFSLLIIPLVMALNFIFFIIPRLDKYLQDKYGNEFDKYAKKTEHLIPWIY